MHKAPKKGLGVSPGRTLRVGLEVPVRVRSFSQCPSVQATTVDISAGGLGIQFQQSISEQGIALGEMLAFETSEDFFGIRGLGEVVWIRPNDGRAGISFIELEEDGANLLEAFLCIFS